MNPLTNLLVEYVKSLPEMRKKYEEEGDSRHIQKECGMMIRPPSSWSIYEVVVPVVFAGRFKHVTVIYNSTESYKKVHEACCSSIDTHDDITAVTENLNFFSWHEMFYAMSTVQENSLNIQRLKSIITSSDCIFFLGAINAPPDVLSQVKGIYDGCLICLG